MKIERLDYDVYTILSPIYSNVDIRHAIYGVLSLPSYGISISNFIYSFHIV